ncbi:MAG: DUF4491 family protein [Muribaculaceae bacterium]|nr:DUF4491 family protein [Muribaculaceae bacterium]
METLLADYHLAGLVIGLATFLIIGLFHPLVIKGYYYFGLPCRWIFMAAGIITGILSVWADGIIVPTLLGVVAFSCFWSIKEVTEQAERVRKGWFPANPQHPEQGR